MSVATEIQRLQTAKADIKTAIENKGVTVPSTTKLDAYADLVEQIKQGGGQVPSMDDDVRFFDYDGELLYSYTKEDFAQLTEMPANPSHEGLTAQGWNWTLTDAKAYVNKYEILDIGQMYITDDGKTRLYFDLPKGALDLPLQLQLSTGGSIIIDWGDGSSLYTTSTSGAINPTHTYAQEGKYMVAITVNSGTLTGQYNVGIVPNGNSSIQAYATSLYKVGLGERFNLSQNMFGNASSNGVFGIETITMPNGMTTIPNYLFYGCVSLKYITIPSSVTSVGTIAFQNAQGMKNISLSKTSVLSQASLYNMTMLQRVSIPETTTLPMIFYTALSLERVVIPDGVAELPDNFLRSAHALKKIKIPNSVTTLPSGLLSNTLSLHEFVFPNAITTIPNSFISGARIREVVIPDTVTTLGDSVFYQCRSLAYVVIGSGVTSIGSACFGTCISLLEVHMKPTIPPTIESNSFSSLPSTCKIYVPQGTLTAYQTATNWSAFASYMVEETN